RLILAMAIASWLGATSALAQATRTYVSGQGNDGWSCTASQPCRTLQRAIALTMPGGQIYALDSSNYGYVTINQAVSITNERAAGVLASSSVTGVTITAGAADTVTLRGLDIDGAGSGTSGIQFNSGAALSVQNAVIRGFATGISFQPSASSTLTVGS